MPEAEFPNALEIRHYKINDPEEVYTIKRGARYIEIYTESGNNEFYVNDFKYMLSAVIFPSIGLKQYPEMTVRNAVNSDVIIKAIY